MSRDIRRAFVTGATSMVGSSVVRACLEEGMEVIAAVRPHSRRMGNLPDNEGVSQLECELSSLAQLDTSQIEPCDAFFHIAWAGSAGPVRDDAQLQTANIGYAVAAALLASRLGCRVFVGAGSQAECGRVDGDITVNMVGVPETGYGIAKQASCQMTRLVCERVGMDHVWSRILSVYGPGDAPHTMVMNVIRDALRGVDPPCTKGEQLWDYLYADDCGRALLAMAHRGRSGCVYPVGSGTCRPLADLIWRICDACATGAVPKLGAIPYYDKQVMHLRADIRSLTEDTGFIPTVSFDEGIDRTIKWCRGQDG